jgi:hypothetical protein
MMARSPVLGKDVAQVPEQVHVDADVQSPPAAVDVKVDCPKTDIAPKIKGIANKTLITIDIIFQN